MDVCLKTDSRNSNSFDIEETVLLICGERVLGERVKLNEGDLEVFGAESFKDFFWEVCHLKHIRDDDRFDARLYQSVLRDWKGAVRFLVWDQNMKDQLLSCLIPAEDGDVKLMNEIKSSLDTKLMKLSEVMTSDVQPNLSKLLSFEFQGFAQFHASINETVTSFMYTNEALWRKAGQVAMIAYDIRLSMGGSEAVVESFYSVMDTQRKVRQNHATLENRAILDWSTTNVLRLEDVITKAA